MNIYQLGHANAGLHIRPSHLDDFVTVQPDVDWVEVHADEFMHDAVQLRNLAFLRQAYSFALHATVQTDAKDESISEHLTAIADMVRDLDPGVVSIAVQFGDLLDPMSGLDAELLDKIAATIDSAQSVLRRRVELTHWVSHSHTRPNQLSESTFFSDLSRRTGCGLVIDVGTLLHSSMICGDKPEERADALLASLGSGMISAIRLSDPSAFDAGADGQPLGQASHAETANAWTLFAAIARKIGPRPSVAVHRTGTLPLQELVGESLFLDTLMGLRIPEEDRTSFDVG